MKVKSRLLGLCAFWGLFTSVSAQVWEAPQNVGVEFEVGKSYYLYNVGTEKYLNQGEAWGSQAASGEEGMEFKLWEIPDGKYGLHNVNAQRDLFRNGKDAKAGAGAVFVDGKNKVDDVKSWVITLVDQETKAYTIQIPEGCTDYNASQYFGFDENKETYPTGFYYNVDYSVKPENCHWYFIDVTEWNRYNKAKELKADLESAKKKGVTEDKLSKAQAVYENTSSTIEQLDEAIAWVKEAELAQMNENISGSSFNTPTDITDFIGLADYKTYSNKASSGWVNEMVRQNATAAAEKVFVAWDNGNGAKPNNMSEPMIEIWSDTPLSGIFYKEYTDLPNGYYTLRIQAVAYDKEHVGGHKGLFVFANNEKVAVSEGCDDALYYEVTTWVGDGTLKVGIEQTTDGDHGFIYIADPSLSCSKPVYTAIVTEAGFGTLCLPFNANLPTGVKAYTITGTDQNKLIVDEVSSITANQPVILQNQGSFKFEAVENETPMSVMVGSENLTSGSLVGTYTKADVPDNSYVLQNHPEYGVAFYRVGTGQPKITPFHAYISEQTANANIKALLLPGSDVTGIIENVADDALVDVYRLDGTCVRHSVKNSQALEGLQRGLYIVNGEKKCVE